MSGLLASCMRDVPVPRYLACKNHDEKHFIGIDYKNVRVAVQLPNATSNSRSAGHGEISSLEGVHKRRKMFDAQETM